jgi:hypothetical protein
MSDNQLQLLDRLRDLEGWAREHDGKSNAKWEEQARENLRCGHDRRELRAHIDANFAAVFKKLAAIEVKVAVFSALAATFGSLIGKLLL